MIRNRHLLLLALLACMVCSVKAQSDSPYSRYGYGVLRDKAVGPSKSMGGIGYGLRNSQSANPLNPASYSRVDSLTFLFDIGVNTNFGSLNDGVNKENKTSGGLDYVTILVPLSKRLGMSVGIVPFSSIGYSFGSTEEAGGVTALKTFAGTGGLSQVYGGVGYSTPLKGLSVGANASFLFGTLNHSRSLPTIVGGTGTNTSLEYTELSVKAARFDIGVQYELPISADKTLTIGAVYTPKTNSKATYDRRHYELDTSGSPARGDTTVYNNVDAGLPETFGLGFTMNQSDKLIYGFDMTYQRWSKVDYTSYMGDGLSKADRFNDRWKFNAGIEYMINPYERSFFKKIKFRGGINYSNSYLNTKNKEGHIGGYKEYGATVGFGLPIRDNLGRRVSYVNINFEYKKLNPNISNMIKEEYFGISFNVNINELWFLRRKVE